MIRVNNERSHPPMVNTSKDIRLNEIQDWNLQKSKEMAREDGIEIVIGHFAVLTFLRTFYVKHGWPKSPHELSQVLEKVFKKHGGKKYLRQLFPDGFVKQGTRLAGLPAPFSAKDYSFGDN
jgi:TusE/DsrC/DsvC family sulfur relay protein